ncbi:MAG: FkbM family methyltransferase [Acidimicrobiales bacterium]|nr:FkbM family methyltransferase [Acidimicrobiales bacterium]
MNLALQAKRLVKVREALRHPLYRHALRQKVLAAVEHQPLLRQLPQMSVVLDVGGNVGQFALVARQLFAQAVIVSFEPLPSSVERLRNVFAGDRSVECVPVALSDRAGSQTFYITDADDSSSLLPVADRQVAEFPGTKGAGTLEVPIARLDDLIQDRSDLPSGPWLLKLDTQGAELAVLQGGPSTLERITHVIVELVRGALRGPSERLWHHCFPRGPGLRAPGCL